MTGQTLSASSFTSASVSPAERFDAWHEAVNSSFVPLEAQAPYSACFDGYLRGQALGLVTVTQVGGDPVEVRRTRRTIAANNPGVYKFALQCTGSCLIGQDQHQAILTPGDLVLYDTTRPYTLSFSGQYSMFVVQIPHESLGIQEDQVRNLLARRIPSGTGPGALTSALLGTLSQELQREDLGAGPRIAAAILHMAQATLLSRISKPYETAPGDVLYLEAVSLIDRNLQNPELSVSWVAQSLHVSIRHLQLVFAAEGCTVSDWIRQRRMEWCRLELIDPKNRQRSVSAIAARCGYLHPSSFSRSFKAAFDISPSEYRRNVEVTG